ncbi:YfcC family protein [Streptobacillus moniliformis]|uniref:YfcC family protein n=1 Tax=Streptobacillus moniliformis TaxID=34105 RepID=UPI0007E35428|nr:YfcC family protein [Streptobacillus moniliformis]
MSEKKERKSLSAFTIIFILLILIALVTRVLPKLPADVTSEMLKENISLATGVNGASISDVFMATFNGFKDAIDVAVFVLLLGGFLGIVAKTGALDAGVGALVKKLKGRELLLIPILMTLFSIGGSTYGMAEETIAFYALISATMVAAGFDTMVAAATVLLGAGAGVLGSTVNPFAIGVALDAAKSAGTNPSNGTVVLLGVILWITTLVPAVMFVMNYAKKIKLDKGSIILSLQEQQAMKDNFGHVDFSNLEFTTKHKMTLGIFAFSFVIMILSLIAWAEYDIHVFEGWTSFLTGTPLGEWYFGELSMWFTFIGIIIGVVNGFSEKEIVDSFMFGAADILSVVLIIALSRGVSVLMSVTFLDKYILNLASQGLAGLSALIFAPASYVLYMVLSFFIPSTSGLASVSVPILAPLAKSLGFSVEVIIMIFSGACGLINLITPTSGVVMGGLAAAKVEYGTYFKWVLKLLVMIFIINIVILTAAMMFI